MFVVGFITGCIFGGCFGVMFAALCVAAKCKKGNHPVKPDSWEAKL